MIHYVRLYYGRLDYVSLVYNWLGKVRIVDSKTFSKGGRAEKTLLISKPIQPDTK